MYIWISIYADWMTTTINIFTPRLLVLPYTLQYNGCYTLLCQVLFKLADHPLLARLVLDSEQLEGRLRIVDGGHLMEQLPDVVRPEEQTASALRLPPVVALVCWNTPGQVQVLGRWGVLVWRGGIGRLVGSVIGVHHAPEQSHHADVGQISSTDGSEETCYGA